MSKAVISNRRNRVLQHNRKQLEGGFVTSLTVECEQPAVRLGLCWFLELGSLVCFPFLFHPVLRFAG